MSISVEKKLGFGAMRLPLTQPDDPKRIDLDQVCQMVDLYLERGFRYFDTAYPYHDGLSEEALRQCLVERYPRERFLLADKMPVFLVKRREDYDLNTKAEVLADKPIYIVTGSKDEVADETLNGKRLYQTIAAFGKGNAAYTSLPSDHSFSDRRIQLIRLIADRLDFWLS